MKQKLDPKTQRLLNKFEKMVAEDALIGEYASSHYDEKKVKVAYEKAKQALIDHLIYLQTSGFNSVRPDLR